MRGQPSQRCLEPASSGAAGRVVVAKSSDKPKKQQKKKPQRTLKERRSEKRAAKTPARLPFSRRTNRASTTGAVECGSIRPMHVFLETERLVLRQFTERRGRPRRARRRSRGDALHHRWPANAAPGDRERDPARVPRVLRAVRGVRLWAAIERASEFVGWFHFEPERGHDPDQVELRYRLRRSVWGRGYATEGSRALIEKGFVELGVERVYATTMVVNVASRRVLEKAGLRYVRTFHQPWPYPIERGARRRRVRAPEDRVGGRLTPAREGHSRTRNRRA